MSGCKLYLYAANTTTPATAYASPGLVAGQELPFPIEADSAGRLPQFWLADGAYRARLTDSAGIVQFDEGSVLAIGAGSGSTITVPAVPDAALLTTGDVLWRPADATKTGWVRLNVRTIASATSGASERANADCQSLFEYLWATFSDTICPVLTGRGPSANADWLSSKQLTLFDMRNKAPFGLDTMGAAAAGGFAGVTFAIGNATTGGSKGGAVTKVLTQANLPSVNFNVNALDITLSFLAGHIPGATSSSNAIALTDNANHGTVSSIITDTLVSGTAASGGSGTAVQTISPFILGSWYMRL